jgi:hypothetical protein
MEGDRMSNLWTCQVCGRAIQARRGVIAHHGYTRPDDGYQTASCFGARALPFELAHDRLDVAIVSVESRLAATRVALREHVVSPPAEIVEVLRYAGRVTGTRTHARPDGFSSIDCAARSYIPGTYEREFYRRGEDMKTAIRRAVADLEFLRARRAEWKEPTEDLRAAWIAYSGKAKTSKAEAAPVDLSQLGDARDQLMRELDAADEADALAAKIVGAERGR